MAEYIEREALLYEMENIKPINWTNSEAERQADIEYGCYRELVEEQPAADVVEVVRCKDCKHYEQYATGCDETVCGLDDLFYNPDDYCSYGERRSNNG